MAKKSKLKWTLKPRKLDLYEALCATVKNSGRQKLDKDKRAKDKLRRQIKEELE